MPIQPARRQLPPMLDPSIWADVGSGKTGYVNADAAAGGTAVIAMTVAKDNAGAITSATANFQITAAGFPAGTSITDAHIHNGVLGSNAGVYVNTTLAPGEIALENRGGSIAKGHGGSLLEQPSSHQTSRTLSPVDAPTTTLPQSMLPNSLVT